MKSLLLIALCVVVITTAIITPADSWAKDFRSKRYLNASSTKENRSRPRQKHIVVIRLPQTGATKNLADGYTLDSAGGIKNSDGEIVALLNDSGIFTNATGTAYSKSMQLKLLGLMGTGLDFSSTVVTTADAAPTTASAKSTEAPFRPKAINHAPSLAAPVANPSMSVPAQPTFPTEPSSGNTTTNNIYQSSEILRPSASTLTPSKEQASTYQVTQAPNTTSVTSKPAYGDTENLAPEKKIAKTLPKASQPTAEYQSIFSGVSVSAIETIITDMYMFHDGPSAVLESLPGWGSGASMPEATKRPNGWQYAIPWTHVSSDTDSSNGNGYLWRVPGPYTGNQSPNTRVQERDLQMWWLLEDGSWVLGAHNNRMEPVMYPLHWTEATDAYATELWRDESDNGGGVSMRSIGFGNYKKHLWHTWAAPHRIPDNAVGAVTIFYGRLILDNPSGEDDRSRARLLAACAGDWYKDEATLSSPKIGGDPNNGDPNVNVTYMGFGRLKYLTSEWQLFGWTSLDPERLRANPPPLMGSME
ncbi:MAG: hypothetical protein ACOYNL_05855 [Rickettsiales bacterium]